MSLASGPASFQRFLIDGPMPTDVDDKFVAALNARSFGRMPPQSDDTQVGWVGRHLFETEITGEHIACGPFVQLAVRVDRLRVPPSVLKAYVRMEEEAALQAGGREFLSRGERRQARDMARDRAEREARAGNFRRMSSHAVLIDLEHRTVYLGSLGTAVADKVMQLFHDTFGRGLEPADAERAATRVMESAGKLRALESLNPFALVRPPHGSEEATLDFSGTDLDFLGREFLTWLWHHVECERGPFKVRGGDEVTITIDKVLRLKCGFGVTGTAVVSADGPARLPEAKAALRIGKLPTKMGLVVGSPRGEFRFTLDGERLSMSGLVLPDDECEENARARLERRYELVADAADLLDAVFELFVLRRTGRQWSDELRRLSTWAEGQPERAPRVVTA